MKTIGVFSGKGGTGKTTFVINLSVALSLMGKHVVAVDFNLTTPHLSLQVGFIPNITLNKVLKNSASIEEAIYPKHNTLFLPASINLKDLEDLDFAQIEFQLREWLKNFDYVIIDSPPSLGREAMIALRCVDEVIFITLPTVTALTDIIKMRKLTEEMGKKVLGLVVNRYRKKRYELSIKEIEDVTEIPVIAVIREDEDFLKSEALNIPFVLYKRYKAEPLFRKVFLNAGDIYSIPILFQKIRFQKNQAATPVIMETISFMLVSSLSFSPTFWPLLKTTILSTSSKTWAILWLIMIIETPKSALIRLISSIILRSCLTPRLLVGSSKIRILPPQ